MSLFSIIAGVIFLAILGWLFTQPASYRVVRGRSICADSDAIFPLLQDLMHWPSWSPWLIHEPDALLDHSDSSDQVGSWYRWSGDYIGSGRVTLESLTPGHQLEHKLEFMKPMRSSSTVRFELKPEGDDKTRVDWIMEGKFPFLFRWMGPMMDRMIGGDFELGLVQLAREAGDADAQLQIHFVGTVQTEAVHYCYQPHEGPAQSLPTVLEQQFTALLETAHHLGIELTAPPFILYHRMDAITGQVRCDICLPLPDGQSLPGHDHDNLPSQQCERTEMRGEYRFMPLAWHASFGHLRMKKKKLDKGQPMIERYVTDPRTMHGLERITQIDLPIR